MSHSQPVLRAVDDQHLLTWHVQPAGQQMARHCPPLMLAPAVGLVEAVSVEGGKAFALAVQWHPEWQVSSNPIYLALFQAFGDACRRRATQRDADASVNA